MSMSNNEAMVIADTIRNQIGANTLMCIGAHKLSLIPITDKHKGGLGFKVRPNPKMKQGGTVAVILDYNDTYTVRIMSARGKMLLDQAGVYNDQLGGQHGVIEGVTG